MKMSSMIVTVTAAALFTAGAAHWNSLSGADARGKGSRLPLNKWQRHVVDAEKPWRAIFITAADMDGDGRKDIITGGWWYKNPGRAGGAWTRHDIGEPLRNMAAVYDFDGDGHMDVLGTQAKASAADAGFVWAKNDGKGSFKVLNAVRTEGDFLQGIATGRFEQNGRMQAALSWHKAGFGIQMLMVPENAEWPWAWRKVSEVSQDEQISAGDIDRDGDPDLLMGTRWLRNDGKSWSLHTLHGTGGDPDRNRLADLNGNGRLDAVVGFEAINVPGKLAWYEQPASPTDLWLERVIATPVGPMSLDVADVDGDGDRDVIAGEHNMKTPETARLLIYENADGKGIQWKEHVAFTGDEHHDGAQVVDIDGDGDLDVISIGWSHGRVAVYENLALQPKAK